MSLLPGCLLLLSAGFLFLVVVSVCRQSASARAQMESAIRDAPQQSLAQPGLVDRRRPLRPKCVAGQVHGPGSMPNPSPAAWPD
jgi:hypothetical protein